MDETIFVLGLGQTLKFFKDLDKPQIGVNDIWGHVQCEIILCIDDMHKFDRERLATIKNSKPKKFITHLPEWKKVFNGSTEIVKLSPISEPFNSQKIYYSVNSPFVAASLASTLGYKNIVLFGVDFLTHKRLTGVNILSRVIKDFKWLHDNLKKEDINLFVGHRASRLIDVLPLWK